MRNARVADILIRHDCFDELLGIAKQFPANRRGLLLASLATSPAMVNRLAETRRLSLLLELAKEEKDEDARRNYLQQLFGNQQLMIALVNIGHYDALLTLLQSDENAAMRAGLTARFARVDAVVQQMIARKQLELLLRVAQEEKTEDARRIYLQQLFGNQQVMIALVNNGHYDAMLTLLQNDENAAMRADLTVRFARADVVVQQLIARKQLALLLRVAQEEKDENVRCSYLQPVLFC